MKKIAKILFFIFSLTINLNYSIYADSLPNSSIKEILLGSQDILPADESFKFLAFLKEDRIILTWELKENCFLYKDKFSISTIPLESLNIKTVELPLMISDEYFGEVEVFYNKVTKSFVHNPLTRKISVEYQGCNEKGFCYPVIKKQLTISNKQILINKES